VNAVTVEQVKDAFARRLDAERLVLISVGGGSPTASR
jgi:predicted Zn-dependent peptidase